MDLDDELQMLQRQLMAVQQQKTNPLSQRTVAEIMIKLHQQGFKFFATTDSNQYVTPSQLDTEIIQFVQERGRAKIGILPQMLNLNEDLIQSRINPICNTKSTHIRNKDNIFSSDYLKLVILEIKQKLQVDGIAELDEIALEHEFNIQFLNKLITINIQQLDAEITSNNKLITKQYKRMKKRKILGYLLAINRPISIQNFMKNSQIFDNSIEVLIDQLIKESKLKGKCQNSYYIPDQFSKNQKNYIQAFFDNNGYVEFNMLQKNFQVSQPEEWINKNLQGKFVIFEGVCFKQSKLNEYQSQLESLLKDEGFVEISTVVPFDLDEKKMEKFLIECCGLKGFVLNKGICFSQEWVNKCVNQFRDKVIYDIFFKKDDNKGGKKKGNKKEKTSVVTESQLIETLFDAGLAQYSVAEEIAQPLMPILLQKIDHLRSQCQKQLTQSQGIINNAFLKYRKCKSIARTQESLQRMLNIIEKQKKKTGLWSDADFGPNQNDPTGQYSLIYYDGIIPKQWPALQSLNWSKSTLQEILFEQNIKSEFMNKSLLVDLVAIIFEHNSHSSAPIPTPDSRQISQNPQTQDPLIFRFHLSNKQCHYVLIDSRRPYVNQQLFCSQGIIGLIEKAYSKLKYCYKSILSIGIAQLIFQLTGVTAQKLQIDHQKHWQQFLSILSENYVKNSKLIVGVGEGIINKRMKLMGEEIELLCMKPYAMVKGEDRIITYPGGYEVQMKNVPKLFKNIYVIAGKQGEYQFIIQKQVKKNENQFIINEEAGLGKQEESLFFMKNQ